MIDMTALRELAKNNEKLREIIMSEPQKMTESEFIAK